MIQPIQYLRGLAALMVVWVHAPYVIAGVAANVGGPYFGGSGVDLFFVISGFIMLVTTSRRACTPLEFFTLRIIRVVPLYWTATLAAAACGTSASSFFHQPFRYVSAPAAIAKSLLFVPFSWYQKSGGVWPILPSGWTINYEMFFYALFAVSLAAPRRFRLAALAATLGSLVLIGKVCGPFQGAAASFYTGPWLLEFVAGMVIARDWLADRRRGLCLSIFLLLVGCACLGSQSRLIVMSGAFLIVAGSLCPRIAAWRNRPLLELGNASYSIYLSHPFVLEALAWCWTRAYPRVTWVSSVLFLAAALGLCVAAGWLCYRFIERPLTSWLRALVLEPRTAIPAAAASPTVRFQ